MGEIAPLRGGYAFQSNNFLEEGIPIVKISNILSTGEVAGEFSFYEELDNDTNFILPDKAAVLAMSGATTGKVSILSNPSNIKFYQNQRVGYFKKTDGINYPFISTLVRSQVFNNQLNSILVTGAQPNVSSKDIDDFDVLIPASYKEQKKIGAYFSNLDHLITLHQRKCIFFTGRAGRLISTVNKKRITSSWEQREVGDLLIERSQQAPMSDEYPLMAFIANEGVAPKGERYDRSALVTDTVNKLYKKTEKGDFIYSSNNLETGSIGLNKYGKACISPVYSIFEPTGIADSDFLGRRLVRKDFINAKNRKSKNKNKKHH